MEEEDEEDDEDEEEEENEEKEKQEIDAADNAIFGYITINEQRSKQRNASNAQINF